MAPFREFTNWDKRISDLEEPIEPFRKYYFLCEGENTERWYFTQLINNQKLLNLHPSIDVRFIEKTEDDAHGSNPRRLLITADRMSEEIKAFDVDYDKIIIVFDIDIYKNKKEELDELVSEMESNGYIIAITNPSFELFLLLHIENAVDNLILPNADKILENKKIGKRRFVEKLLADAVGCNPKTNEKTGGMSRELNVATRNEGGINGNS